MSREFTDDMTRVSPNRRERLRAATVVEIKQAARRLLADGGPSAVSLRAIARDMGMTAPAIYRYFPSLEGLVTDLCADLYTELREEVEAARDQIPAAQPARRLAAMARAFRRWCVTHRAEFSLMFGEPVPGVAEFEERDRDARDAGAQFGAPFLTEFGALWQRHRFRTLPPDLISERLASHLAPHLAAYGDALPIDVVHTFLSGWIRLYGLVAMEVFGHLSWAVTDAEPLFETEINVFVHQLTRDAAP